MMRLLALTAFCLGTLLLVSACGQKGPLKLPDESPRSHAPLHRFL